MAVLAVAATVMVLTQEEDPGPDATRPAANSATVTAFLGGPDYVGFCRATGQGVAEVSGPTAYDRGCTQPHGSGVSATEVCAWTYHTDRLVDRIADFNDPSSIECWSVSTELGPLDFDDYCRRTGYTGAVAVNTTAYAWYCDGKRAIDSQAACALLYRATPAVSRFSDFHNRDSWTCHA
ncbi:hypothetical protein [Yinghuangia sp. YIM S09857]|uniref:hypothetical protein n=1 Tax=Yinghuangia sp. YIM S09857 TaxID=3436929 RepID=UPI003F53DF05